MQISSSKKKIAFYYDDQIGNFFYGAGHPMKPNRVRMTYQLVKEYQLFDQMSVIKPCTLPPSEMIRFHSQEYVHFLQNVTPENQEVHTNGTHDFLGRGECSDCPVFKGLFEFCQKYSGGSVCGGIRLNHKRSDVVVNWLGGFHHAKKTEATGFCYINDIVLAILELLKYHSRVMYIDIDVHHGDGVEEAFYCTNRVLTLSFHKGGDFFPGTGKVFDTGHDQGINCSLNFPMEEGMDDEGFFQAFEPIVDAAVARYRPEAVVLQCGADSLAGDRLGCFNLTSRGHGRCVKKVMDLSLPTLVLGGGGYTVKNVARCWAYETSVIVGKEITENLPMHSYYDYYAPDFELHVIPTFMKNFNTISSIEKTSASLFETLKNVEIAPSVTMYEREMDAEVMDEPDLIKIDSDEEENEEE